LASQAMELVGELEEEEDIEVGFEDFKVAKREAEKMVAQGTAGQGLRAAMRSLEELMVATKLKEQKLLTRLQEIQWLAKDSAAYFKDADDTAGRIAALSTLTRAHLMRASEPDAPMAALKSAKEADELCRRSPDDRVQAEVLILLSEAHVAKAIATPYAEVLTEEVNKAAEASRTAEELFKQLDDKRGLAKAMHATAKALLRHTDEDEMLEGERMADEARDLYHDSGDTASEVAVLMTGISARHATSGPESALMMASDAAEDWQQEGGRPKDAALALLLAAGFQLELGEHAAALKACGESQTLNERAGNRRGIATSLETKSAIFFAMKQYNDSLQALEEMANLFQKMGDKKSQGNAYMMAANMLLSQLSDEVETDTQAEFEKKAPKIGISTADVHKRSANGLEYATRASKCFEEGDDVEGKQSVTDLLQGVYNKAIQLYCRTNEPDMIYYIQKENTPQMDESKCIKEWRIPMPSFQKTEGLDKGDGFLHIFDPHPPPKM